jgi:hypothetical protein
LGLGDLVGTEPEAIRHAISQVLGNKDHNFWTALLYGLFDPEEDFNSLTKN